jgi:hypothetical protein
LSCINDGRKIKGIIISSNPGDKSCESWRAFSQ